MPRFRIGLMALLAAGSLRADVLVLDRAAKTVSRVDPVSLAATANATLSEVPTRASLSPGGGTLVVLCRGEGNEKYAGFRAKTRSKAFVLDARTLAVRAEAELGWGLGPAWWNAAGDALTVVAPGFPSSDAEERQPAALVVVEASGKTRRIDFGRAAGDAVVTPDGSAAAVIASAAEGPAQIWFCDLGAATASEPVVLGGGHRDLLLTPDGATLYALLRGKPKGFGNVPSVLTVFSMSERRQLAERKLCAITGVGGFDRTGRLILGGGRAGDVKENRLYVVKGTAVEYDVAGPSAPTSFRFSADGATAWALGWSSAFVDFKGFAAPPAVTICDHLLGRGQGFELTPDGKLALVYSNDGRGTSELVVYELPSGRKLKSFDTASFGSRLVQGLAAGAATFASIESGRRDAAAQGRSTYTYSIYGVRTDIPRGAAIAVRPDGRTAFVYDAVGDEILAVDLEKLVKGKRQSAGKGSRGLYLTGGGKTLLLASDAGLHVFDAANFDKPPVVTKTDGPADLAFGPSGETHLVAKGLLAVVDPATGALGARTSAFKDPVVAAYLE